MLRCSNKKRRKALRHPESPAPRHGLATPGAGRRHLGALGSRFPSGGLCFDALGLPWFWGLVSDGIEV